MFKKIIITASIIASAVLAPVTAMAQQYRQSTIQLGIPNGSAGFSLSVGETVSIQLPRRLFVHKVLLQVDSAYGNSGAELSVNGDRKGNTYLSPADPSWVVTVEQETGSLQLTGITAISSPQGRFNVRAVHAIVTDTDTSVGGTLPGNIGGIYPPNICDSCSRLPFPLYYRTVMGNVSNRAIILVDRLATYSNYQEYGTYLLPIKKAAAEARSVAEARGDASAYGRPYFEALLKSLDCAQPYLSETFERSAAFEWSTEILTLREYIRDILD
jgi:hypothetical protein